MPPSRLIPWGKGPDENERAVRRARRILLDGGVIVFPTETFYGLGADGANAAAVERIYAIKDRERKKALPLLFADEPAAGKWVDLGPAERVLAGRFWPGPLTLVAPLRPGAAPAAAVGGRSAAVRVCPHPFVRRLLAGAPFPLTATSANLSGRPSPSTFEEAMRDLDGLVEGAVDADPLPPSLGSTVVRVEGGEAARILRRGDAPAEEINLALKEIA